MNKLIIIILLLLFSTLYANVYEDAEDNRTNRWVLYNSTKTASIRNIYDKDRESRVIFLDSYDSQNGYMLAMERNSTAWCKTKGKNLKWSMKADKDFVIMVSIQTERGHRYIIYTSGDKNGIGYYGLGAKSIDGEWHEFARDLDLDLRRYEPSNHIIAVDSFFVRGGLIVDDIEIVDIKKRDFIPKKIDSCTADTCHVEIPKLNSIKESRLYVYDNKPPSIKLNGYSILFIKLGEEYIEQGATASDDIDGSLPVDISEEVNSDRVGTYTLFYIARDSAGNSAITTRIVNVGSVKKRKQEINKRVQEELKALEFIEEDDLIIFPEEDDY